MKTGRGCASIHPRQKGRADACPLAAQCTPYGWAGHDGGFASNISLDTGRVACVLPVLPTCPDASHTPRGGKQCDRQQMAYRRRVAPGTRPKLAARCLSADTQSRLPLPAVLNSTDVIVPSHAQPSKTRVCAYDSMRTRMCLLRPLRREGLIVPAFVGTASIAHAMLLPKRQGAPHIETRATDLGNGRPRRVGQRVPRFKG